MFDTTNFKANERLVGIAAYQNIVDRWRQVVHEEDTKPKPVPVDPSTTPEAKEHLRKIEEYKRLAEEARIKEPANAQLNPQASPNYGSGSPQPSVRQEGRYTPSVAKEFNQADAKTGILRKKKPKTQ